MELREIKERMKGQKLYYCNDEVLAKEQLEFLEILYDFNATRPSEQNKREELLKAMFAPNVTIATGTHPIHPELRRKQAQYNMPVYIGKNVWIGAGAVILPGISIGENTGIGAGSIVTKDIPANVIAVGNPCEILRKIDENDLKYYHKNMKIDIK